MSLVSVVLVDDHPAVRAGLTGLLDADDGIVIAGTAATAAEGLAAIEELRPDTALLDYHLPGESGLMLCLRLQELDSPPCVVVYSAFADERLRVLAAVAGASAVVSKAAPPDELLAAVRGEREIARLSPRALREVGAGLDTEDLAMLGMLCHGVPAADVAATLGIGERDLVPRRRRMLERMTRPVGLRPLVA